MNSLDLIEIIPQIFMFIFLMIVIRMWGNEVSRSAKLKIKILDLEVKIFFQEEIIKIYKERGSNDQD